QLVKDDTQTENIAAAVHAVPLAPRLLGAHVRRRAEESRPTAYVFLAQSQPEIGDVRNRELIVRQPAVRRFGVTLFARGRLEFEENVARLDVAVDKTLPVRI